MYRISNPIGLLKSDDTVTFRDWDRLLKPRFWPDHSDLFTFDSGSNPECHCGFALTEVTATPGEMTDLTASRCLQKDTSSQTVSIGTSPNQFNSN